MTTRFAKALVATLFCFSFVFGAGCTVADEAKRSYNEGEKALEKSPCKAAGRGFKKRDSRLQGKQVIHQEFCRRGGKTFYEFYNNKWVRVRYNK